MKTPIVRPKKKAGWFIGLDDGRTAIIPGIGFVAGAAMVASNWEQFRLWILLPACGLPLIGYGYAYYFLQNKPPHYYGDALCLIVEGKHSFTEPPKRLRPQPWLLHSLAAIRAKKTRS